MQTNPNYALTRQTTTEFLSNSAYTAIAWIGLFEANAYLFENLVVNEHVSWIFLPAALRILAVLVAGTAGVAGLFIGSIVINLSGANVLLFDALSYSAITAITPFLAIWILSWVIPISTNLLGLRWWHILLLAALGALFSVFGTQLYLAYKLSFEKNESSWLPMLVGDLVGTLIMLYVASFLARLCVRLR